MRTYGYNRAGQWVEVTTTPDGFDDYVWFTTLCQTLKMVLGEAPFDGNSGIPAERSVIQQIFPDYYVSQIQQQFAPRFGSLIIAKQNSPSPTYQVNATTQQGLSLNSEDVAQ